MERILTTAQLGFTIGLMAFSIGSALRCIITQTDTFYTVCFTLMAATAWFLMVKPAWTEYKKAKADKKGGR